MLAADKLQLQSALKQQAVALKEKEFQLHHSNLMTVGTQAAVLAGLDITMFIEFAPTPLSEWSSQDNNYYQQTAFVLLQTAYYTIIVAAFCANMIVVSHTTALSVLGAGMALRGPDGSMMTATDGLYEERRAVFITFAVGLACTVGSVLLSVWLLLPWQAALWCWAVALYACRTIYVNYRRVIRRFGFDESETVDLRDIMEGPALQSLKTSLLKHLPQTNNNNNNNSSNNSSNSRWNPFQRSSSTASEQQYNGYAPGNNNNHNNHHYEWDGHSFHDQADLEMQQQSSDSFSLSSQQQQSSSFAAHRRKSPHHNNSTAVKIV